MLAVMVAAVDLVLFALEVFGVIVLGGAALFAGRGRHQPWTGHADG